MCPVDSAIKLSRYPIGEGSARYLCRVQPIDQVKHENGLSAERAGHFTECKRTLAKMPLYDVLTNRSAINNDDTSACLGVSTALIEPVHVSRRLFFDTLGYRRWSVFGVRYHCRTIIPCNHGGHPDYLVAVTDNSQLHPEVVVNASSQTLIESKNIQ
jgi:hypothetical protein